MKSSINCSSGRRLARLCFCLGLSLVVSAAHSPARASLAPSPRLAVLQVNNLGSAGAPLKEIQRGISAELRHAGIALVEDGALEKVMAAHRMRYTGGVDAKQAKFLKDEAGVDAVLITCVELYQTESPPKIALTSRLVSIDSLRIEWMESVAATGSDRPGLLDLGVITDHRKLQAKAVRQLAASLAGYLAADGKKRPEVKSARVFGPKIEFAAKEFRKSPGSRVAVVPFFNESTRYHAGEILLLHFLRQLVAKGEVQVVEPGAVRERMLEQRIIMLDGLSFWDLNLIGFPLEIDYFVTGRIFEYGDYSALMVSPKNDFSVALVSAKTRKVVWASSSYNAGDDAVYFFDAGNVSTAGALADRMVSAIAQRMQELSGAE